MENQFTGVSEVVSNRRLEIMSRIQHPEEYYKQAFAAKGIDLAQLTHAEISVGIAAMKAVEADLLIWAAENMAPMSNEDMDNVGLSLINKGW